jgi:uncharacterized protein YndB with AHSA1/START domain
MSRLSEAPATAGRSQIPRPLQAIRFEGTCRAPAEAVYDLLADLQSHLEWAGARQLETTRLPSMDAPSGPATVGTEFATTGTDGKVARFADRSVVTEATRPSVFEFVTESTRQGKPGTPPMRSTLVHHYEVEPVPSGCRLTYVQELTRIAGAPRLLVLPGIRRAAFRVTGKYMRRGFDALLALAEERSGRG